MRGWFETTPFAVVDLETTGADPQTAEIVQVAVVQIDMGQQTSSWKSLVKPTAPIPAEATAVHGISNNDVADAPSWEEVMADYLARTEGRVMVGYNAIRFDWPILRRYLQSSGIVPNNRGILDAFVLIKHIDRFERGPGRHKLDVAARRWGVSIHQSHDALGDCLTTWGLLMELMERGGLPSFGSVDEFTGWVDRQGAAQEADFQRWLSRQKAGARR